MPFFRTRSGLMFDFDVMAFGWGCGGGGGGGGLHSLSDISKLNFVFHRRSIVISINSTYPSQKKTQNECGKNFDTFSIALPLADSRK